MKRKSKKEQYLSQSEKLIKLKKESGCIQELLYRYKIDDYISIINKLNECSAHAIAIDNRINQQGYSCNSFFCPICAATKDRREYAIAYAAFKKLNNSLLLSNGGFIENG